MSRRGIVPACLAAVGALLVSLALPRAGSAQFVIFPDTLITFDDLSPGTTVTDQYQSSGVLFLDADPGFLPVTRAVPPGQASSGSQVVDISTCPGHTSCEFFTPRTRGRFTSTHSRVTVFVGQFGPGPSTAQVQLIGRSAGGAVYQSPLTTVTAGAGFHTTLTVTSSSPTPDISSFEVIAPLAPDAQKKLGFDDLQYDNPPLPPPPDFELVAGAASLTVRQGASINLPIAIGRLNGSNGDITFSASGLPPGVGASFSPNPASGTGTSTTLTLTADLFAPPAAGTNITITGTPAAGAGPAARSVTKNVGVVGNFTVEANDGAPSVDLPACTPVQVPVRVLRDFGFTGTVDLSVSGVPSGVQASLAPAALGPAPDGSAVNTALLNLSAAPGSAMADSTVTVTGGSAGTPAASDQLTIHRVPQRIDFLPASGTAPQLLRPGTEVTLSGGGFCAGSRLQFGNSSAEVTPTSISADGSELKARVPRLATTGELTVIQPGGTSIASSGDFTVRTYRNTHGFSFDNYPVEWISFEEMTDLFGLDEMFVRVNPCYPFGDCSIPTPFPDVFAYAYWGVVNVALKVGNGHCFGMGLTTQQLQAGEVPYGSFPPPFAASVFGLAAPGGPSGSLHHHVEVQHIAQMSAEFFQYYLARAAEQAARGNLSGVLDTLEDNLRRGRPVLITMRSGIKGHVVVAYDVEDAPGGGKTIFVYDTNHPFVPRNTGPDVRNDQQDADRNELTNAGEHEKWELDRGVIQISPFLTSWSFPDQGWTGGPNALVAVPQGVMPDDPTLPTNRQLLLEDLLALVFGSPDGSAETAGVAGVAGADPALLPPLDSEAPPRGGIYLLRGKGGFAHTVRGTKKGSYDDTLVTEGFLAQVDGVRSAAGVVDRVLLDADARRLRFQSGTTRPLTARIVAEIPGRSTHSAVLHTTGSKGGSDDLVFAEHGETLVYRHDGAATTYTLDLAHTASNAMPTRFSSGKLLIRPGDTVKLRPTSWRGLTSVKLTSVSRKGRRTTRMLRDRSRFAGRFRVAAPRVVSGSGGRREFVVQTVLGRVPRNATAIVAFRLTRNGRLVGKHAEVVQTLRAGKRSDRWQYRLRRPGRYRFTGLVTLAVGGAQMDSRTQSRSVAFSVP